MQFLKVWKDFNSRVYPLMVFENLLDIHVLGICYLAIIAGHKDLDVLYSKHERRGQRNK
jgi:hypothetical protein